MPYDKSQKRLTQSGHWVWEEGEFAGGGGGVLWLVSSVSCTSHAARELVSPLW